MTISLLVTYGTYTIEYLFGEYRCSSILIKKKLIKKKYTSSHDAFRLEKPINHEPFPLNQQQSPRWVWSPVYSWNGLICLVSNMRNDFNMCVYYNPLAREYVNLLPRFSCTTGPKGYHLVNVPAGTIISPMFPVFSYVATGFGYHPVTKEYKIVRIYYENNIYCSGQVSVYVCVTKTYTHQFSGSISGMFANGALHWLGNRMLDMMNKYIVSFDLVDEEFRIIPSPPPNVGSLKLGVLEGCLNATGINSDSPQNSSDVWVMSKHDDQEEYTWSKKYNIPWNKFDYSYNPPLAPLDDHNDNKILLHYDSMEIVSYDTKRACLDGNVLHTTKERVNVYKLIPFRKSITSLKALGEVGARIGRIAAANSQQQQQLITSSKRKMRPT